MEVAESFFCQLQKSPTLHADLLIVATVEIERNLSCLQEFAHRRNLLRV